MRPWRCARRTGLRRIAAGGMLAVLLTACSGGGGHSPTEPDRRGGLDVVASVLAVTRTGFLEITVLLDGETVGRYVSPYPDGVPAIAPVIGSRANVSRGAHTVEFRFDRMTTPSATVQVDAVAFFVSNDTGEQQVLSLGIQRQRVERGGVVRFGLPL